MKVCTACNVEMSLEMFHKKAMGYLGHDSECKVCRKARRAKEYQLNSEKIKAKTLEYKRLNKEKVSLRNKNWHKENLERIVARKRLKRQTDIQTRLRHNLRSRFKQALKCEYKGGSAIENLGCSIAEFKIYIESMFEVGMTWENYALETWHIDHIKSLHEFDLTNPEHVKEVCHYTNLRPLWAKDNLSRPKK